eukprot:5128949-Prymnesium_polylepis.1
MQVPNLYYNLLEDPEGRVEGSLMGDEINWERLQNSDSTGFCGLSCNAVVMATSKPDRLSAEGYLKRYYTVRRAGGIA